MKYQLATLILLLAMAPAQAADSDLDHIRKDLKEQKFSTSMPALIHLAGSGDLQAEQLLAECYENGTGVPEDRKLANQWYDKAAMREAREDGDRSLTMLHGKKIGNSVKQAVPNLLTQSKTGDAEALNKLGFAYQHAIGIKRSYPKAMECYEQAVSLNNADAQNNLAFMLLRGEGTTPDAKRAFLLFNTAAQNGNMHAVGNLGWMYLHGQAVEEDAKKAFDYYEKAAAHGVGAAKFNLGMMYEGGVGVPCDLKKSDKLFQLAVSNNSIAPDNDLEFVHTTGSIVESHSHGGLFAFGKPAHEPEDQSVDTPATPAQSTVSYDKRGG